MTEVPLIDALKPYKEPFNVKYDIPLPTNTPYGNLLLTYTEMIVRMECLNDLIVNLYEEFYKLEELVKIRGGWMNGEEAFKHKFQTEQVIYWLRKTADEVISLLYLLNFLLTNSAYPEKIKISNIGELLKHTEALNGELISHIKLLTVLNEISNGFKHSIINAQTHNHRGKYEPVVFALVTYYNDIKKTPKFHQVSLREILIEYNNFLKDAKTVLENKCLAHKPKSD